MDAGITLVSIGVGTGIDMTWLATISDFTYDVSGGYGQLNTIVDAIVQASCTDVDVAVGCSNSSVAVGGNTTVQIVLDNRGAYNVTSSVPFTVALPSGLTLLSVTQSAGAPPGMLTGSACVHTEESMYSSTCIACARSCIMSGCHSICQCRCSSCLNELMQQNAKPWTTLVNVPCRTLQDVI
jgi:hypothetical protein